MKEFMTCSQILNIGYTIKKRHFEQIIHMINLTDAQKPKTKIYSNLEVQTNFYNKNLMKNGFKFLQFHLLYYFKLAWIKT